MTESPAPKPTTQTPLARMSMTQLHEVMADLKPELKEDSFGDLYVSIPVGSYEAIEIETYETPSSLWFTMSNRAWDRTGGMSRDDEVGESRLMYLIEAMVRGEIAHQKAVNQRAEQAERAVSQS